MSEYLIVSAATEGSRYVLCLDRQREIHGDKFYGIVVPDRGKWAENTKIKPDAVLAAFEKSPCVMWLDSDCTINAPAEFPPGEFDIGIIDNIVASHRCRMSAAFILFRDTPMTRLFLNKWKENNQRFSKDHPALKHTIDELRETVKVADVSYWLKGRHSVNDLAPERPKVISKPKKNPSQLRALFMPCRPNAMTSGWPVDLMKGAKVCGDAPALSLNYQSGYDAYVFWGMRRAHGRQALAQGNRCVVVERAYLGDRFSWTSVGLNGLNGRADFRNADAPTDRWEQHWKHTVKPWRDGGDYALIIGQVLGDAALCGVNPYDWAQSQCHEAKKKYGKVYFRPHPLCKRKQSIPGAQTLNCTESEAFAGAAVVITHSSNFGVLAVMEGVPVVAEDVGSMVYAVSSRQVSDPLVSPDRNDWGRRIAYAQWTPAELADGSAWRHITRGMR